MPTRNKFIALLLIFTFAFYIWTKFYVDDVYEFEIEIKQYNKFFKAKDAIDVKKNQRNKIYYRRKRKIKYILLWPINSKFVPFMDIINGEQDFKTLRCPVINCYVTTNMGYFEDIRDFDVIAFNGNDMDKDELPDDRAGYQKYIYFNIKSSAEYPVMDEEFDGFFNGTATYRLDSDIPLPHLLIRDGKGNDVGPMIDMNWKNLQKVDRRIMPHIELKDKKQAAAIYMNDCESISSREEMIENLHNELEKLGYAVDVYGRCGSLECKPNIIDCYEKWRTNYYFYLVYENALAVDYVTDKLLIPLHNDLIPIVYGGANYSRFLPPKSYLNAMVLDPKKLAEIMVNLINSPEEYLKYFWWKYYYTYHNPKTHENICNICSAITDEYRFEQTEKYYKFRNWWNINYTMLQA